MVQVVLLLGAETWGLFATISDNLEGVHMGFLRKVTVQKAKRQRDGTWRSAAEARVIKEAGTHTLGTCIDKQQATVV